jgi:hypothetical protein
MVTDAQVRRLKKLSKTEKTQELAATKAGMDPKTARRYLATETLPSELKAERYWRTRDDPFESEWETIQEQLRTNPGLEAKTIFEQLQREHPGKFNDGQLRTLQRHIKHWRATEGPSREVFFRQEHIPGRLGQSDFTRMAELGVAIGGQTFPHMVYHFVLTYSNWEDVTLCYSESFESLSEGLQNALWRLGGVPRQHRTDRLSTAVNNMTEAKEFTDRYTALVRYYKLEAQKIQAGKANENGDIEQRHHRWKRAVEQALLLRGSRDFTSIVEYANFLRRLVEQLNAGRRGLLAIEMPHLQNLPERRLESLKKIKVRVESGSVVNVERNVYSIHSRLIGEDVEARLKIDTVEIWYSGRLVETLPRLRGRGKHRIDYRHIIDWLVRKPGAFENYQYREELFPTSRFRMAWDALRDVAPSRANRRYLEILQLAAKEGEARVDEALRGLLETGEIAEGKLTAKAVGDVLEQGNLLPPPTSVVIAEVSLATFDELLGSCEVMQ